MDGISAVRLSQEAGSGNLRMRGSAARTPPHPTIPKLRVTAPLALGGVGVSARGEGGSRTLTLEPEAGLPTPQGHPPSREPLEGPIVPPGSPLPRAGALRFSLQVQRVQGGGVRASRAEPGRS